MLDELIHELDLARLAAKKTVRKEVDAKVVIEKDVAAATSPEGKTAQMPVEALLAKATAGQWNTGPAILPDGIKAVISQGAITLWVWEAPPGLYNFDWIAADSPAPFGPEANYRKVRLALPYVIIVAVFARGESGLPQLQTANECFFRNKPLTDLSDDLHYPALLNCSKFEPNAGRPLSWICTQHLRHTQRMQSAKPAERLRAGFEALRHCLLETAFNLSSEHHETASWFTESKSVDPRLRDVESWEKASAEDPLFALEVPWLKTGHSVQQLAERIFKNNQVSKTRITSAAGLGRIIFNHK